MSPLNPTASLRDFDRKKREHLKLTFEHACTSAFGKTKTKEETETETEEYEEKRIPVFRTQYRTFTRLSSCPKCRTTAPHIVLKHIQLAKGRLLECVWCYSQFSTVGNCR